MYRASIYLDLLPEIPMYCCPVKISYFGCYIKIRLLEVKDFSSQSFSSDTLQGKSSE